MNAVIADMELAIANKLKLVRKAKKKLISETFDLFSGSIESEINSLLMEVEIMKLMLIEEINSLSVDDSSDVEIQLAEDIIEEVEHLSAKEEVLSVKTFNMMETDYTMFSTEQDKRLYIAIIKRSIEILSKKTIRCDEEAKKVFQLSYDKGKAYDNVSNYGDEFAFMFLKPERDYFTYDHKDEDENLSVARYMTLDYIAGIMDVDPRKVREEAFKALDIDTRTWMISLFDKQSFASSCAMDKFTMQRLQFYTDKKYDFISDEDDEAFEYIPQKQTVSNIAYC